MPGASAQRLAPSSAYASASASARPHLRHRNPLLQRRDSPGGEGAMTMTKQKSETAARMGGGRGRGRPESVGRLKGRERFAPPAAEIPQCRKPSSSGQRADVYSRVTAEIIAAIEQGAGEWRAPWFHNGSSIARPINVSSAKRYRGINTLALWAAGFALDMAMAFGAPISNGTMPARRCVKENAPRRSCCGARSGLPAGRRPRRR